MSKFTSFQMIAYRIPTLKALASGDYVPDKTSAVGKGLEPAAQALVQRFAAVLNFAKGQAQIDAKATTLKVFVAPEFYFKGPGAHWGSFTFNSMINILDALKGIKLPGDDWVVIAGSVVFYLPEGLPGYKHADGSAIDSTESVYVNLAPVLTASGLTYVKKHEVSSIDGPPTGKAVSKSEVFKPVLEKLDDPKARFIEIGDRVIGLEVCLDHLQQQLAKAIAAYPADEGPAPPIDLHVITACGMSIKNAPQARDNGYVLLCDGVGWGTDTGSQASKVVSKATSGALTPKVVALPKQLTVTSSQTAPEQGLAIYPTQSLP